MQIPHSHIILDACCVLNLCATGHFLAILKSLPAEIVVTVVQERELNTLQRLQEEENDAVLEFEEAIQKGLLKVVDFESEEEEESFVNYTVDLDDGESATCALAFHRGWAIETDDKGAIRFIQQTASYIQILSTPEIIKHWSAVANINSSTLRDVLKAIRFKANYSPPNDHPLRNWWTNAS
ncbi:hypothetical protein [Trichormus variabilis]|uniref:PIN domain-containing protein n=1 Tax=Trichormus variabilis SAG 1403-4b TaxID=447716 RepID=A0A3S5K336_ANAVA|nr:hypothetical protein [Trichormus variabilis]MBD2626561.1 hypothetical protein [Trichormus variabilis FACHB-164]RUS95683.1 hypothetical protein DSM107003_28590 [Trichormus variabilis SAG 1403-4b]